MSTPPRSRPLRPILAIALGVLALLLALTIVLPAQGLARRPATGTGPGIVGPQIAAAVQHDLSAPLITLHAAPAQHTLGLQRPHRPGRPPAPGARVVDAVAQLAALGRPGIPAPVVNFEGVPNVYNPFPLMPPDTEGDVGPNHYVQWVNIELEIFNKAGGRLVGPVPGNTPWTGFGGPCEMDNDGDPVALYDPLADRWLLSQFAAPNYPSGPYYQCFAVSQTPDPTQRYYRYAFVVSTTLFNDYPKFGVWPDAYYGSFNLFDAAGGFDGAAVAAFDRRQMLSGQQASSQLYILPNESSALPADLDGATPPPPGTPGIFVALAENALHFFTLQVDWDHQRSTLSGPTSVAAAPFNPLCPDPFTTDCIPQPGTQDRLDGLGDRLMFRAAYRNLGDHQALVLNHSADLGTTDVHSGIRWYEIRDPAGNPTIYQQGTYAPDAANRWLGSAAMDHAGDIALGYSVSSAQVYPSIRYTGRLAGDPPGTLPQGEGVVITGTGSQLKFDGYPYDRWGDYSMLAVDPRDDCTFWYTQEYVQTTGQGAWQTRIAAFRFPGCDAGTPTPTVTGTPPTALPTVTPQPSATVTRTPPPSPTYPPIPTATPCPIVFSDVHPADYFYQAVEFLACNYLISGYSDGTFRPYNLTTRAQVVKIVLGGGGTRPASGTPAPTLTSSGTPPLTVTPNYTFADVPPENPFFIYVQQAAQDGIVSGYLCGGPGEPCDAQHRPYFRPNAYVTRGQLAKIQALAFAWTLVDPPTATFADVPPTAPFYRYIETASCRRVISGYSCGGPGEPCDPAGRPYFRPNRNAIRGQIAKIVYGAIFSGPFCQTTPTVVR